MEEGGRRRGRSVEEAAGDQRSASEEVMIHLISRRTRDDVRRRKSVKKTPNDSRRAETREERESERNLERMDSS